jgi:hypothetical protein
MNHENLLGKGLTEMEITFRLHLALFLRKEGKC